MSMDYTLDHVKACEPAMIQKQAALQKKIQTGRGKQPSITPIQCGDLDGDQNDSQDNSDRIIKWEQTLNTNQMTQSGPTG